MEAIFAPSSADQYQSVSPYKQMKNPTKKSSRGFISCRPTENMAPANNSMTINGGLLFAPPSLYCSYPPSLSLPLLNPHQQHYPPLLPLPISKPHFSSLPSRTRDLSRPLPITNTNRKNNRPRDHSLTAKKSKQPTKREELKQENSNSNSRPIPIITSSAAPLGPSPNDMPKVASSKILTTSSSSVAGNNDIIISSVDGIKDFERFSGSVFPLSPPPSSLPLPKFSVRPKLSCNAEAAGIDAGTTDNLRQLLRLR